MKYPFINCEHPVKVVDHITHTVRYVNCGHCRACALQKAREQSTLCDLEEDNHDWCWFVTGTYDSAHIPFMKLERNVEDNGYIAVNLTARMNKEKEIGNVLFEFTDEDCNLTVANRYDELCKKVSYNPVKGCSTGVPYGCFPYINSYEILLFRTRLRTAIRREIRKHFKLKKSQINELEKYGDFSFRFYITREYGPLTFRPHWHMLFFTNSALVSSVLRKCLHSAWPYGDIKLRKSNNGHQSYLTEYVNNSFLVPDFLKARSVRPASTHSQFFGAFGYLKNAKEVHRKPNEDLCPLTVQCKGKVFDKQLWMSLQNNVFPRCTRYAYKSVSDKLASYTIYEKCALFFGEWSVTKLAEKLASWLRSPIFVKNGSRDLWQYFSNPLLSPVALHLNKSFVRFPEERKKLVGSLVSELYKSKQFYKLSDYGLRDPLKVIDRIDSYYSFKQLYNLGRWYEMQDEYRSDPNTDKTLIPFFYQEFTLWSCEDNGFRNQTDHFSSDLNVLYGSQTYQNFCYDNMVKVNDKIKHREMKECITKFNYNG